MEWTSSLAYCDDPAAEGAQMIADKVTTARNRCIVSGGDAAEAEAAVRAEMEPQLEAWLAANGKKQADWVDSNWETCDMVTATINGERVECEFYQYVSNTEKQKAMVRVCGAVLDAETVAKMGSAGLLGGPGIVVDTLKNLDLVKIEGRGPGETSADIAAAEEREAAWKAHMKQQQDEEDAWFEMMNGKVAELQAMNEAEAAATAEFAAHVKELQAPLEKLQKMQRENNEDYQKFEKCRALDRKVHAYLIFGPAGCLRFMPHVFNEAAHWASLGIVYEAEPDYYLQPGAAEKSAEHVWTSPPEGWEADKKKYLDEMENQIAEIVDSMN